MPRRTGRIEATLEHDNENEETLPAVAIAMPVYNEDTSRVMAGLKAMYLALEKTGKGESFDFFVLSDSTDPEKWIREEYIWSLLCRRLKAFGRIHYRRRSVNTDKKAGNLLEFCQDWGRCYRYMITLDADSLMGGDELVNLVRIMERNHNVGICQTAPRIVYGESFWGRLQQFSTVFMGRFSCRASTVGNKVMVTTGDTMRSFAWPLLWTTAPCQISQAVSRLGGRY